MNNIKKVFLTSLFSFFVPLVAMEETVSLSDSQAQSLYNLTVGIYDACLSANQSIIDYNKAPSDDALRTMNDRVKFLRGRIGWINELGVHDFDFAYDEIVRGALSEKTLFSVAFAEYDILSKLYFSKFRSILPNDLAKHAEEMKMRVYGLKTRLEAIKEKVEL